MKDLDAIVAEAFRVLADRVHPLALGDVYRSKILDACNGVVGKESSQRQPREYQAGSLQKMDDGARPRSTHYPFIVPKLTTFWTARSLLKIRRLKDLLEMTLMLDFSSEMLLEIIPVQFRRRFQHDGQEWSNSTDTSPQKVAIVETPESRYVFEQTLRLTSTELQLQGQAMKVRGVQRRRLLSRGGNTIP